MSSSQWACVAVEADEFRQELSQAVETERRAKISEARKAAEAAKKSEAEPELIPEIEDDEPELGEETSQLIVTSAPADKNVTGAKTAAAFNTNRTCRRLTMMNRNRMMMPLSGN